MGKQDIVTKEYISRNDIFSELVNYYIFSGKRIIRPEDLRETDATEGIIVTDADGKEYTIEKYRDIFKKSVLKLTKEAGFLFIGIEDQTMIHYAMPVRSMLYDSISYAGQIKDIARLHRKQKDKLSGEEFLSGMTAKDKLIPIITIVVYFGQKEWSAPKSLHEMFGELSPKLLEYIENYHIHLIDPHQMKEQDFEKLGESLQYVMRFIAASGDKTAMVELLKKYPEQYGHMEKDAAELLKACTNINIEIAKEKEEVNMCKAWDDMAEDSRKQGLSQGIENVIMNCYRLGMSEKEIAKITDSSVEYVKVTIVRKQKIVK